MWWCGGVESDSDSGVRLREGEGFVTSGELLSVCVCDRSRAATVLLATNMAAAATL